MYFLSPLNQAKPRTNLIGFAPITLLLLTFAVVTLAPGSASGRLVKLPFDAGNFPPFPVINVINNPFWPLPVGATFVYLAQTEDECSFDKVTVTANTKLVLGVQTRVVRDQSWVTEVNDDGSCNLATATLTEDTEDYYAQDIFRNIWYFGEATRAQDPETLECTSEGSWLAGAAPTPDAEPGIIMLARPQPGLRYRQELAEDVAEDLAAVLRVNASVSIDIGEFNRCVKTKEWTPLAPGEIEHKFYCFDAQGNSAGLVLIEELKGKTVRVELIGDSLPAAFPGEFPPTPFPAICGP
jgi:hypothetical protein